MSKGTKRPRWLSLQFSLRTLFIVIAIVAVWLGYQRHCVKSRKDGLKWIEKHNGVYSSASYSHARPTHLPFDMTFTSAPPTAPAPEIPWLRKLLGDRTIQSIGLPQGVSQADRD